MGDACLQHGLAARGWQRFLEFADVDLQHGFLHIQSKSRLKFHVKNYQHRYIPLASQAREGVLAQRAKKHPGSDFVFHRPDGSPWGDIGASFDQFVVRAAFRRKCQRRGSHRILCRHTFASWLAIAGASLRRIQELLGHKSITTTERYSHLGQKGLHHYYCELATHVSNGFVTRFVTSEASEASQEDPQLI